MAVGKSKSVIKKGKGLKKKTIDPFSRKDWYNVKVPTTISNVIAGKTLVNRTIGTKIAADALLGRVFEFNLADLKKDAESFAYRKMKFVTEDVQGNDLVTVFHSMSMTTDKYRFLVRKWQSLIEAFVDVTTTDGFTLRVFAIAFTARAKNMVKKTCYAQSSQIKRIRAAMVDVIKKEITSTDLNHVLEKFVTESLCKDMEHRGSKIYPISNVFIQKVKMIKRPKMDNSKIMSFYNSVADSSSTTAGSSSSNVSTKVSRSSKVVSEFVEPKVSDSI